MIPKSPSTSKGGGKKRKENIYLFLLHTHNEFGIFYKNRKRTHKRQIEVSSQHSTEVCPEGGGNSKSGL